MSIKVRYFASLRESLGRSEQDLIWLNNVTVRDIWRQANPDKSMPDNLLAAVNLEYADFSQPVNDGDEIAFFPPVTGG